MTEIIEILCREHRNMEKVLRVLERELGVFQRGDRPDYDVLLGIIDYPSRFMPTCCGTAPAASSPVMGTIHARFQDCLGHKDIRHTVRYTALSPKPFRDFWRD